MFAKMCAVVFGFSIISVALARPFDSETHIMRVHTPAMVRVQVLRAQVIIPDTSTSCTPCATSTVIVSGTATASVAFTVTVTPTSTSTPSPIAIGNFGSCTVPQIEFGAGFDGHNETSFRPVDRASYNHDSADNIVVITDFICNSLVDTCGADPAAQATCAKAQEAAAAQAPQEGIDADAFNAVFGIQTNFKNVEAFGNSGDPVATTSITATSVSASASTDSISSALTDSLSSTATSNGTSSHSSATDNPTHDPSAGHASRTTLITAASPTAEPTDPVPTSATGNTDSNNLQSFTGALGGISAPPVVASGSQFQVEGNSLINKKADALARSCDVQENDCADAANRSGNKGSLTVAACHTQQENCIAASAA